MSWDVGEVIGEYRGQLLVAALVLTRIAPLVLLTPVVGLSSAVPMRLRIGLVVCLTALIVPVQLGGSTVETGVSDFVPSVLAEALIGASIALALACVVAGLQLAGQVLGSMSGLSLAQTATGDASPATPLVGRVIELTALAAFLAGGGHRIVLDALLDTFRYAPVGQIPIQSDIVRSTLSFAAQTFLVAFQVAAPVAIALLLSVMVVGLVSRLAPQLNSLSVGLGLNTTVLLAVLSVCLGSAAWLFQNKTEMAVEMVRGVIGDW